MPASTNFSAGTESNSVRLSYAPEVAWGTAPAVAFKALRMTGESLSGSKQRQRPGEINYDRQASAAITTQESAGGGINFALSYGTFDDLIAGVMGEDWFAAQNIVGIAGDITVTAGTNKMTSTLGTKFAALVVGQWIRLSGFTASSGINNGFYRIGTKTSNSDVTLVGGTPLVTETPAGTAAVVKSAGYLRNDLDLQSFFVEKTFGTGLFARYPGAFFNSMNLNGRVGQYMQGSFNLMAREEQKAVATASTGAIVAAPTGRVHDTVSNFEQLRLDDATLGAVVQGIDITLTNDGAAADYGIGSASAQGMRSGMFTGTGRLDVLFRDFTLWDRFKTETGGRLSFRTKDNAGNGYVFTALNATIMNPRTGASGPNQAVASTFDIEMNPDPLTGKTFQIDRFAA